ncbi:MAG: hypothetical protein ACKVS8_11655 [Phycisphaerales bacterium]
MKPSCGQCPISHLRVRSTTTATQSSIRMTWAILSRSISRTRRFQVQVATPSLARKTLRRTTMATRQPSSPAEVVSAISPSPTT